jgi:hypothetical protein
MILMSYANDSSKPENYRTMRIRSSSEVADLQVTTAASTKVMANYSNFSIAALISPVPAEFPNRATGAPDLSNKKRASKFHCRVTLGSRDESSPRSFHQVRIIREKEIKVNGSCLSDYGQGTSTTSTLAAAQ